MQPLLQQHGHEDSCTPPPERKNNVVADPVSEEVNLSTKKVLSVDGAVSEASASQTRLQAEASVTAPAARQLHLTTTIF